MHALLAGGSVNSIYQIDISCRSHHAVAANKYIMTSENKYFDDLIVLCGEVPFDTLALWVFHFSGGLQTVLGVMAITGMSPSASGSSSPRLTAANVHSSKVVLNPGPDLVLGACDAIFVIGSSRQSIMQTIIVVCEKFLGGEDLPFLEGHEHIPWSGPREPGAMTGNTRSGYVTEMKEESGVEMGSAGFLAELLREGTIIRQSG